MPTLNDLRDRARHTLTEARSLLEAHHGSDEPLPADLAAHVDALIAQGREQWSAYEAALAERERLFNLGELDHAIRRAPETWSDPNAGALLQSAPRENSAIYRKAFQTYIHHGERAVLALGNLYVKALTEGIDSEGGHLVPVDWQARILQAAGARTGLRKFVTAVPTSRDAVEWPTIEGADDVHASAVRRTWVDEQPAEGAAATQPTFGAVRIPVHTAKIGRASCRERVYVLV